MKKIFLLALATLAAMSVMAQQFDACFVDSTLRLDYFFAGNNRDQHIYFEKASVTPRWAGRRARLADVPLKGNGQIVVKRHDTGETLFVHTFSTLFQEWQATEEAVLTRLLPQATTSPCPGRLWTSR